MKILIAGFGSIGRRHFRNLITLGEHDILFYRTQHSTLDADELTGFTIETDLNKALAHHPQAVIVSNPTALHLNVAIPAAEMGCHIFMEKPLSHSMEGIDDLATAIKKGGGHFLTGFQFRFHPGLITIHDLLRQNTIGKVISAHAHWGEYLPGWHPWEDYRQGYSARADLGGGVVLTLCHPLDYLRWLIGEIKQVSAMTAKLSDLELSVEDTAQIGLRFDNGAIGNVYLDYIQKPPSHHLQIIGDQGEIHWDNSDGKVKLYRRAQERWETINPPRKFERNDLFLKQMQHFRNVAHGKAQPICTLEDGVRALQIALAVHESQATGKFIEL
ncbi:MAG TPA: Gfo/Idh/MocA family oxidoreductase [Anaerolineales bacterium]|nr:Gfo/Idh/MocA family oxidoreductase [Anaerolineales bacterium]